MLAKKPNFTFLEIYNTYLWEEVIKKLQKENALKVHSGKADLLNVLPQRNRPQRKKVND